MVLKDHRFFLSFQSRFGVISDLSKLNFKMNFDHLTSFELKTKNQFNGIF